MNAKTENVRDFLNRFTPEELANKGILRGQTHLLQARSVDPLIEWMRQHNVEKLEFPDREWFLSIDLNFNNPQSNEDATSVEQLVQKGNVFNLQNVRINPHFRSVTIDDGESTDTPGVALPLESALQAALRQNIQQLEPDLKIIDGGKERKVASGWIDITAEDGDSNAVAIELKAGVARPSSIAQVLAYMSALEEEEKKPVRGLLVASDFPEQVILAAKQVPNLELKSYLVRFSFEDR